MEDEIIKELHSIPEIQEYMMMAESDDPYYEYDGGQIKFLRAKINVDHIIASKLEENKLFEDDAAREKVYKACLMSPPALKAYRPVMFIDDPEP